MPCGDASCCLAFQANATKGSSERTQRLVCLLLVQLALWGPLHIAAADRSPEPRSAVVLQDSKSRSKRNSVAASPRVAVAVTARSVTHVSSETVEQDSDFAPTGRTAHHKHHYGSLEQQYASLAALGRSAGVPGNSTDSQSDSSVGGKQSHARDSTNSSGSQSASSTVGNQTRSREFTGRDAGGLSLEFDHTHYLMPTTFGNEIAKVWKASGMIVFSGLSAIFIILMVLFEITHLSYSEVDFDDPCIPLARVEAEQKRGPGPYGTLRGALTLWCCFMRESALQGLVFIALNISLVCLSQYANTLLVSWSGDFWDRVQQWGSGNHLDRVYDFEALLLQFLFFAFLHVFSSIYQSYIVSAFTVAVRMSVTHRYLSLWFSKAAYYRIELAKDLSYGLDNPDQRIQEDSDGFVSSSIGLVIGFGEAIVRFVTFSHVVWVMSATDAFGIKGLHIPGWLFWSALVMSLLESVAVHFAGWRLKAMTAASERTEADFRSEMITVREYSETVALSQSEEVHRSFLGRRFDMLRRITWESMFISKNYGMTSSCFSNFRSVFILVVCGNLFLEGTFTLGRMMSAKRAYDLIQQSTAWFPNNYASILAWSATTCRLLALEICITKIEENEETASGKGAHIDETPGTGLITENLCVWVPATQPLDGLSSDSPPEKCQLETRTVLSGLQLKIEPGARILLEGPSGIGKSSLIRALSGTWPFASGNVIIPGKQQAMFCCTDVYVPNASLRAAVAYPRLEQDCADKDILEALRLVKLGHLSRAGKLTAEQDWNMSLSHGEKARISLARVALHRPRLAVLDEPVAHLPESMQASLLADVFGVLPADATILVVSHALNKNMLQLFTDHYVFDGDGKTLRKKLQAPSIAE